MYIVLPRRPAGSRTDVLRDAVHAVLAARDDFAGTEEWRAWAERPRKVCVRRRPAELERVRELPQSRPARRCAYRRAGAASVNPSCCGCRPTPAEVAPGTITALALAPGERPEWLLRATRAVG